MDYVPIIFKHISKEQKKTQQLLVSDLLHNSLGDNHDVY